MPDPDVARTVARRTVNVVLPVAFAAVVVVCVVIGVKTGSVVDAFVAALLIAAGLSIVGALLMIPSIRRDRKRIDRGEKP
jgi:hypothetical protein